MLFKSRLIIIPTHPNSNFLDGRAVFTKIDGSCRRDELGSCDRSLYRVRSPWLLSWAIDLMGVERAISETVHKTLLTLVESSGETIQKILDRAIENYRRYLSLPRLADKYIALLK